MYINMQLYKVRDEWASKDQAIYKVSSQTKICSLRITKFLFPMGF